VSRERALRAGYLVAVTALGAWLRLRRLGSVSFWLDEILGYDLTTAAARQPLWRWLGIFDLEHGPLYYATELAGRFLRSPEASARVFPALLGVATIVIGWFAARAIRTHPATPYVFVLLLAVSPLHVYYSREARPYSLVVVAAMGLLAFFLREPRIGGVAALLLAAFYTSAATAPLVISAAIVAAIRRWWAIAATSIVSAILIVACYRGERHASSDAFDWSIPKNVLDSFSSGAIYVFIALALVGAVDLFRRNREQSIAAIGFFILPIAIAIAAVRVEHHFFAIRYVISALPAYLLLVSVGVAAIVAPLGRWKTAAAILAGLLLAFAGWHAALTEPFRKLDWRSIAGAIARHAHENDPVIADTDASAIAIGFYLRGVSPHLRVFSAHGTQMMGEVFAYQNTTSWIVVAGGNSEFSSWARRFPVVLSSPIEDFRLYYSPTAYYFLTDRSTPAEHRALLASFGGAPVLYFGPGDDDLLGDGWSRTDRGSVIAHRAFVALPIDAAPDHLTIDVAAPQSVTLFINDNYIQTIEMHGARKRLDVPAPRTVWRRGINIVRLEFGGIPARVYELGAGGTGGRGGLHRVRIADTDLVQPR
jgi:mannosyltransferase